MPANDSNDSRTWTPCHRYLLVVRNQYNRREERREGAMNIHVSTRADMSLLFKLPRPPLNRADALASSFRSSKMIMLKTLYLGVFMGLRLALANGQGDREESSIDRWGGLRIVQKGTRKLS